jgi:hypothetical protein
MGIDVSIKAGLTTDTSNVSASGSEEHVITDTEVNSFGIQDGDLKNAIGKYFGKNPNDAYLHSPTPWNDLYKTYNWPQVETVLVVESATITGITSEPTIVATQVFSNDSKVKGTFNVGISQQVSNTTSSTWSKSDTITVGQKISYKVSFLGSGGGGETSLSYSHTWGESKTETLTITVGTTSGVSVTLDPGQSVTAQLTASRGVMKVRMVYKAYLIGDTAVNYNPTYRDHHFWALDIGGVMGAGGIANVQRITEDIEIGFYTNSKIELKDAAGKVTRSFLANVRVAA